MAKKLWESDEASLTRFCGPSFLGGERRCFQIDGPEKITADGTPEITFVCLTSSEAEQMALAILRELGTGYKAVAE